MDAVFNCLSWMWGVKDDKSPMHPTAPLWNASFSEFDSLKFPLGKGSKVQSQSRRLNQRKWHSREERRNNLIDREYDLVLVPPDGGCLSGSESDDSDWSIGWLEPHSPDFLCDDERETSFAVLVPCYGRGRKEKVDHSSNRGSGAVVSSSFADDLASDGQKFVNEWLSSL